VVNQLPLRWPNIAQNLCSCTNAAQKFDRFRSHFLLHSEKILLFYYYFVFNQRKRFVVQKGILYSLTPWVINFQSFFSSYFMSFYNKFISSNPSAHMGMCVCLHRNFPFAEISTFHIFGFEISICKRRLYQMRHE